MASSLPPLPPDNSSLDLIPPGFWQQQQGGGGGKDPGILVSLTSSVIEAGVGLLVSTALLKSSLFRSGGAGAEDTQSLILKLLASISAGALCLWLIPRFLPANPVSGFGFALSYISTQAPVIAPKLAELAARFSPKTGGGA